MKYLVFIPCVNRIDLLEDAIKSVKFYWNNIILIDNTIDHNLKQYHFVRDFPVISPIVPLTFSQTMNAILEIAKENSCDFYCFMHNDAVAAEGTSEKLLEHVQNYFSNEKTWGVAFTNGDTLCAFNTAAMLDTGKWDTVLPLYFSDNDYYRRLLLKGYKLIETGLTTYHQNKGSNTIHSDFISSKMNIITYKLYRAYYIMKWGGPPHNEKYTLPFNGKI